MKKVITLLLFSVMLLSTMFISCYAHVSEQKKVVYDRADVFAESEIAEIEAAARGFFAKSYASVYVVTDNSKYANTYDGDDFMTEFGISGDGIILVITDNASRNYNIYPYGKCYSRISDEEYNEILDASSVYNNIKAGNYKAGAISCIELCELACRPNVIGYVTGAVITVLAVTGIFIGCTVYSYKKKMRSEKYPLDRYARLDLSVRRDDFITKLVTVQVIKSSSSDGSRGGSRGGGRRGR